MNRYSILIAFWLTIGASCGNGAQSGDPCDGDTVCAGLNRVCVNNQGTAVCAECLPGYVDESGTCVVEQVDPCAEDTVCAGQNRECIDNQGTAECGDCLPGYTDDSGTCVADQTCQPNTCSGHGSCDDSGGTPVCSCDPGYAGDHCEQCAPGYEDPGDGTCQPVDACADDTVCAGQNRECVDNQGTAECGDCLTGFGDVAGSCIRLVCTPGESSGDVQAPEFQYNLWTYETGWFASPVVADLDDNGSNELIAAYYSVFVYDKDGGLIDEIRPGEGRVYAPHLVADIDGDTVVEVVFGSAHEVYAYEWVAGSLQLKTGWPVDTTSAGDPPEIRGLAAADLDGNGSLEVIATTTQMASASEGGSQVYVFSADGSSYQPAGLAFPAWPRYNNLTGPGGDADRNGMGHHAAGCFGLNVGVGDVDGDPELEIIVTFDSHQIQAFDHDGVAINAADWFTNPSNDYLGERLTWGQFIRWADPLTEENHYHLHAGDWPQVTTEEWLQWTDSPPNVVDLDGDGLSEVVGIPDLELGQPYVSQAFAIMVLEGAHGDGSRSAMRKAGWETLPRGGTPIQVDGWYPPRGVPAATTVDIQGDERPEIVVSLNDGNIYAFDADATELWRHDYTHSKPIMFASEVTVADLNQDGFPELVFATFGDPDVADSGNLVILAADGTPLHDIPLPNPGDNNNGIGAPAAPAVYDLNGDGQLEILVQTFDHGLDVFSVPGSGVNCVLWPTGRGGATRTGSPE